jgi:hypothetical protein
LSRDFLQKVGLVFQNPDDQLFSPTRGHVAASREQEDLWVDESLLKDHGLEFPDRLRLISPQERKQYIAKLKQ